MCEKFDFMQEQCDVLNCYISSSEYDVYHDGILLERPIVVDKQKQEILFQHTENCATIIDACDFEVSTLDELKSYLEDEVSVYKHVDWMVKD